MKILNRFSEKPLEVSMAIVAIFVGSIVPVLASDNEIGVWLKIMFSVLAVVGGALLSTSLVSSKKLIENERESMKEAYYNRLSPINRHLASLTKEISNTIRSVESNQLAADEGILLIEQSVPNLVTAMTDIGEILGERFEPSSIFETAQKVEELNRLLTSINKESRHSRKKELLKEAQSTLAEIHPDVYKQVSEVVKCPHCDATNQISIGKQSPASAMTHCRECESSFHCHRDADGSVFTSIPNQKRRTNRKASFGPKLNKKIECKCGARFHCSYYEGKEAKKTCMHCGRVTTIGERGNIAGCEQVTISTVEPANYNGSDLFCSEHVEWSFPARKIEGRIVAVCRRSAHLLRLKDESEVDKKQPMPNSIETNKSLQSTAEAATE